jgi:protein-tyrosine phosphatase
MLSTSTSENNPIRVNWVLPPRDGGYPGQLGMTFLPGKRADGLSGKHQRTLSIDLRDLREAWKVDDLVLLVEDRELVRFGVPEMEKACAAADIELRRFPIVDVNVPSDPDAFRRLIQFILSRLKASRNVVIACRGGLGRTGVVAACTLIAAGLDPEAAIETVRSARHGTIQTLEQEAYVRAYRP